MIDLLWLVVSILVIGTLLLGLLTQVPLADLADTVTGGFGELMAGIGLSVGFGIILGQLLSDSGGARVIARTLVNATSERFAMYGLAGAAFVLSIPVFYDVTFVILVPLALAIAREAQQPMPLAVGVVALGSGTSHTLVPPTPNPLAAGEILNFDVGVMLLLGGFSGMIAMVLAVAAYSTLLPRIWSPERDQEEQPAFAGHNEERPAFAGHHDEAARPEPGFFVSLLPILTPVILILTGTVWAASAGGPPTWLTVLTDKTVALLLGVLVAYLIASRTMGRSEMEHSATTAVSTMPR